MSDSKDLYRSQVTQYFICIHSTRLLWEVELVYPVDK